MDRENAPTADGTTVSIGILLFVSFHLSKNAFDRNPRAGLRVAGRRWRRTGPVSAFGLHGRREGLARVLSLRLQPRLHEGTVCDSRRRVVRLRGEPASVRRLP